MNTEISMFLNKLNKEELSEYILINKSIKGDVECFEILLNRYKGYLYKIAYGYMKNEYDSLDLIQECSYKAWINIKKLKKESSFKFWISKILINTAISTLNKNSKINYVDIDTEIQEDIKIIIEERVDIHNALELLKPEYKTVIILKYFEDMTIESISEVLDLPQNTVKTYIRRAKACIKKILKDGYLYE